MGHYAVTSLAWDLEHVSGLLEQFQTAPGEVLDEYTLTSQERSAIEDRDRDALLAIGVNPVALRNLMVLIGGRGAQMYTQSHQGVQQLAAESSGTGTTAGQHGEREP